MKKESRPTTLADLNTEPVGAVFPSPRDWRDQVLYFLLVDRFDNNAPDIPAFDAATSSKGRDAKNGPLFQGGNLRGIIRRLDYIQDLGATAIWLSPIIKNRLDDPYAYHGYGIQDFLSIDPRYGTLADLQELVHEAHVRGLYVILDIVINHTGDNWSYAQEGGVPYRPDQPYEFGHWREANKKPGFQEDDAVWPVEFQNPDWYKRRGSIIHWNDYNEAVHGDFMHYKELDLGRADVLDAVTSAYKYWIAMTDIDGFRIDTVKHIEDGAALRFANGIKEYAERIGKKNFFLFGEIVGDDNTIKQYVIDRVSGGERLHALDACLDFPLYFFLEEVIKGFTDQAALRDRYDRLRALYPDTDVSDFFVTFVDNHDQMHRPYKRFLHNAPQEQMILAIGYLLTSAGIPCIYYGSEQGFDGGGAQDFYVREAMFGGTWGAFDTVGAHCFNPDHPLYRMIRQIANIRKEEPALRYGRQYFREISEDGISFSWPGAGGTLAFSRVLDTDELIMVLNLTDTERTSCITIDTNVTPTGSMLSDLLHPEQLYIVEESKDRSFARIPLAPHQIRILKRKIEVGSS
jgi:glycosidase